MKRIVFIVAAIFAVSFSSNKNIKRYFEGIIKYKNEYYLKTNQVSKEYLDKIFGKTAILFFKDGNYIESYDKGFMLQQVYRTTENKYYVKKNSSDSLFWYDCSKPGEKMISFEINKKKETILGVLCDEYITRYKTKTVTFYFNPDTLKLNPEWYKEFTLTNKNINTGRMGSLYLKYKIEYPDFIFTVTATEIKPKKVDEKIFELNPKAILIEDK